MSDKPLISTEPGRKDVCLDCHGRGEIDGPDRKVYGGKGERGWIEPSIIKCQTCDGTGEVSDNDE